MTAGYAPVNGLDMYYEVHGEGRPIVLLHGGLQTVDLAFGGLIPKLAADRKVIAAELQGHGRTADTDREYAIGHLADDVAGLLDHLGVERADLLGFSLGGLTGLQFAVSRPDRLGHLVLASTQFRADGFHEEISEGRPGSRRMPTEADFQEMHDAYVKIAPDPGHFQDFAAKLSAAVGSGGAFEGWTDDALRSIASPTLVVVGDTDFVRLEHAVEMHGLVPDARLAVLPGTTHIDVMRRDDLLVPMLKSFLP